MREIKAKLSAMKITCELERKKRMLKKQLEQEEAEEEMRRAKSKAEMLKRWQIFEEETALIEEKQNEAMLRAELELLEGENGGSPQKGYTINVSTPSMDTTDDTSNDDEISEHHATARTARTVTSTIPNMNENRQQAHVTVNEAPNDHSQPRPQETGDSGGAMFSEAMRELLKFTTQQHLPLPDMEPFKRSPLTFLCSGGQDIGSFQKA